MYKIDKKTAEGNSTNMILSNISDQLEELIAATKGVRVRKKLDAIDPMDILKTIQNISNGQVPTEREILAMTTFAGIGKGDK